MITIQVSGQTTLTPKNAFDIAANEILKAIELAEHQTLKTAGDIAHERSSGTATEQMLGTAVAAGGYGHPYGHGPEGSLGPRGPIPNNGDAGVVNIQTGEFASGWQEEVGYFSGDEMTNSLRNDTEHAQLLEATPDALQIRRPVVEGIENIVDPIRKMNLDLALQEINRI